MEKTIRGGGEEVAGSTSPVTKGKKRKRENLCRERENGRLLTVVKQSQQRVKT